MEPHEFRLLKRVNEKLDYAIEVLGCLVEAMQAEGDSAKLQAVTKMVNESTAKLKAKLAEVDKITGENDGD